MPLSRFVSCIVASMFAIVQSAAAQNYPTRFVRILTTEAGGGSDFNARLIAPGLSAALGQQVIVENRPSSIPTETVAKAPPDGHTLLFTEARYGCSSSCAVISLTTH